MKAPGSFRLYRRLHQERRNAAGAAAHGHHPRSRLAAGANFGDVDAASREPRVRGVDIGHAPAYPSQLIVGSDSWLARPVRDLDDEVAAAEEHQPAPLGMRTIERHLEPEPGAVECRGA